MGTVIGPIDQPTWNLMRQINTSLTWMRKENVRAEGRWDTCIEKEGSIYDELKNRYVA